VSHARIVVLEDDPRLSRIMKMILESAGYDVTTAADLDEARRALAETSSRLLITDLHVDATPPEALLDRLARGRVRSIVVSGAADGAELARRFSIPFVAKPFTAEELVRVVREAIDGAT